MPQASNIVYLRSAYREASAALKHESGTAEVFLNLRVNAVPLDTLILALHHAPGVETLTESFINVEFSPDKTSYPIPVYIAELDEFCAYMSEQLGEGLVDFTLSRYNDKLVKKAGIQTALSDVIQHHNALHIR